MKLLSRLWGSPFAFALAAVAALAMVLISETSYREATKTLDRLSERATARTTIQTLWRSLTDAETGQRGYLLTGRKEYLKPFETGKVNANAALEWLDHYYRADPQAAELMSRVAGASRNKLSELDETLKLYADGKEEAWKAMILTNIGAEQMDRVRTLSEDLLALESARVAVGNRGIVQTLQLNRIGVTALTALCLLALFMYLRLTSALAAQREEQQRVVQAERDQLEREVAQRTDQLIELARHLQTAREDERSHLARELHDELGALLTAAKLDVARLKSRLAASTPEIAERMQHLTESLNNGIALKRRIIEDLRPSSLSNLGLVAALEILLTEWSTRTEVAVDRALEPVALDPAGELSIYRLVQEALTNITKYAKARHVEVVLESIGERVRVTVRDDGVGFDARQPRASAHGLIGMRYRLESSGGQLTLRSAPGRGTTIEATLPERRTDGAGDAMVTNSATDTATSG